MRRAAVACAVLGALAGPAVADDEFAGGTIIFARGGSLYRTDARGKSESEIATLPAKATVRALRTDASGSVLLVDLGGKWSWMPLDGSAHALTDLPCGDGPAQLTDDGGCLLCRAARGATSQIVSLHNGVATPIDVPVATASVALDGTAHRLIWADASGVWSAPPGDPRQKTQIAPEPPLRNFLASHDGARAVGTYGDNVYTDAHHTKPAEVLNGFALDGKAARRKAIRDGVPLEWSHDNTWLLVQDGVNACVMRATGGEYKCWKGYTATSVAPDGKWALLLGPRDKPPEKTEKPSKKDKKSKKKGAPEKKAPAPAPPPPPEPTGEPSDEPEDATPSSGSGDAPVDDIAVAPPGGALALYRAKLEGAFTDPPAVIVRVLDGAAVWVPKH